MKLPVVSGKEVFKALLKAGFVIERRTGHVHLIRQTASKTYQVTIPIHANEDLAPSTLQSILKQSGLTREEFCALF